MSLIGSVFAPVSPGTPSASNGQSNANKANENPSGTDGTPAAGTSEASAASAQSSDPQQPVPAVTGAQAINPSSGARSGHEGSVDPAEQTRVDAATGPDREELQARRYAEETQRQLIAEDILSRIPVSPEELQRLASTAGAALSDDDSTAPKALDRRV
ncbi:MAG: hypothetical protein AAFY65_03035 [Pseudomonadota bacterium]